jgi:hypothetical protein
MSQHFDAPRSLYRWQLGLIAASLPRKWILRAPRGQRAKRKRQVRRRAVLSLSVVPLQLAPSCRYQDLT